MMRLCGLLGFALAVALPVVGYADLPGKHPAYLHALSDLRAAYWLVDHRPGDAAVSGHEDVALQQIGAAVGEIKRASIDDGKDLHDHPKVDVPNDQSGRLHQAEALLKKVHADVAREEDDPTAKDLKHRALDHVDQAINQTDAAIWDVEHHK